MSFSLRDHPRFQALPEKYEKPMSDDVLDRLKIALADRYTVERELGRGGMATVYLAQDLKHRRQVAIKVLLPELASAVGPERFLREIEIAARLHHPHVLPLYDSGDADGFLYYVMPFAEGESLRDRLDREKQLPLDDALQITREVADALGYAHGEGVLHRDIKPENILLESGHAVVADFGIARAISAAGGDRLTETGLAIGTPTYMSPEQAAGEKELDGRSDLYSLGCVLYEMLAGQPPFTGPTVENIRYQHLVVEPRPVTVLRPRVPEYVAKALNLALAKAPADRFSAAAGFVEALDPVSVRARAEQDWALERERERRNETVDKTFRLSETVCQKLNRATLDPRIIGDNLHYLDNQVESDVLLCYLHGLGLDQREFDEILRISPYRGVAPTLYGFEAVRRYRVSLSLDDHVVLIREFLRHVINEVHPAVAILVGFSSGADLGFQMLSTCPQDSSLPIDGFLSLGCNLDRETLFVSPVVAGISTDDELGILSDLRSIGTGVRSLDEWLNLHDYLIKVFRKLGSDIGILRSFASDLLRLFESTDVSPFADWFRVVSANVRCVRCVFADTDLDNRAVERIRLENLDSGVLGEYYREGSIVTEMGTDHFELIESDRIGAHVEEMVTAVRK